ncbi:MAG: nitrite reductase (NAD(P)H) small subunit [Anaerolineae bacterium]|nr:nitrite reductase (NAD(P)H) small subunit [Anaerolineae bacterium]
MTTSTIQPKVQLPKGYVFVCERSAIPARGKKTIHIGDLTLLIVACNSGLYAIEDRCPQTGGSIAHGKVLDCAITTPTTGARYCLRTGRYLGGGQSPLQSHMLRVFSLREIMDKVYVGLG